VHFDIGKQKVVWILKCREQHEEAAGNALRHAPLGLLVLSILSYNYKTCTALASANSTF
jgi:hypothetical protein